MLKQINVHVYNRIIKFDDMKIRAITTSDVANGPGFRVVVWVAGCKHNCPGCHNPELQDYNTGYELTTEIKHKIYTELSRPEIQGITFSGGDPLYQTPQVLTEISNLINEIKYKFPDKDIWLYTGFKFEDVINDTYKWRIIDKVDVLVDGPYEEDKRNVMLAFRGSANQRIINIKEDGLKWKAKLNSSQETH